MHHLAVAEKKDDTMYLLNLRFQFGFQFSVIVCKSMQRGLFVFLIAMYL